MALLLNDVLADPARAARVLECEAAVFGIGGCSGRRGFGGSAIIEMALEPLPALANAGFPIEHVRIVVLESGQVFAFPRYSAGRPFKHRNSWPASLCLEYDNDDPALRWQWGDGLEQLVTRVHRHLMFEEQWRRTGKWPTEDAPHDYSATPYPIRSQRLQHEVMRWAR